MLFRSVHIQTKQLQRQWKDATINRHFAYIRHIFTLAVNDGKLDRNPMTGVKLFPESNRTIFLSNDELVRLSAIMAPEHWRLVAFAVETGLRRSEQFSLRWDHVNLESGVLTIPISKSGKTRHVPLSDNSKTILRSLDTILTSPFVFPSVRDQLKPFSPSSFLELVYRPALRRAGIIGANWHSLRHTCASRKIMAGVDVVTVKELLGHQDIETTLKYSHLSPTHLKDSVNKGTLDTTLLANRNRDLNRDLDIAATAGRMQPVDFMARHEEIPLYRLGSGHRGDRIDPLPLKIDRIVESARIQ